MRHNPIRKRAVEKRAVGLAVGALQALTDGEEDRLRGELMGCIRELQDDHNSIALQWENEYVKEAVRLEEGARWNEGIEKLFSLMQKVVDDRDWSYCPEIYKTIARLSSIQDRRI